jgi:YggT family protein
MRIYILNLVNTLFQIVTWVIIIRSIVSWIPHNPYHWLMRLIYNISEPFLSPFRGIVPPHRFGGIDLSPIIALLVLWILNNVLLSLLL